MRGASPTGPTLNAMPRIGEVVLTTAWHPDHAGAPTRRPVNHTRHETATEIAPVTVLRVFG